MASNPFLLLQDGDAVDSFINKQNVAAIEKVKRKQALANSKPKKPAPTAPKLSAKPAATKPAATPKPAAVSVQKKQAPAPAAATTAAPAPAPEKKKQESQPSKAQDKPKLSVKVTQKVSSAPPAGMDDLVIDKKAPRSATNAGPQHRVDVAVRDGKRQYERHSGTGRGTEMKKGGHGKGNWDTQVINPADIPAEKPDEDEEPSATVAAIPAATTTTTTTAAAAAEQAKPAEAAKPPPPEPVTMKEFLQKQAKKAAPLPVAVPRHAGEGEDDSRWKQNFVPLVRTVPDELLEQEHQKKQKKAKAETAATTDAKKETKKHKAEKVAVNFTLPPIERAPPPPRFHDDQQEGDRRPPRSFNKEQQQGGARPADIKFAIHKTAGNVPTTGVTKAIAADAVSTAAAAAAPAQPFGGRGRTRPPVVGGVADNAIAVKAVSAPPPQLTLEQFPTLSSKPSSKSKIKQARKEMVNASPAATQKKAVVAVADATAVSPK